MITYKFEPQELRITVEKIKKRHPTLSDRQPEYIPDIERRKFIESLVSLDKSRLKKRAISLTRKEINTVIDYLPRNAYNLDMSNLFVIFKLRSNESDDTSLCYSFYNSWQNSHNNKDCNNFIISELLSDPEDNFCKFLGSISLDKDIFHGVLLRNIPHSFGMMLKANGNNKPNLIETGLKKYGINKNSALFNHCCDLFYTYCSASSYLEADKEVLSKTLADFTKNTDVHKLFVKNFLSELTLGQLSNFKFLIQSLDSFIGELDSQKFNAYFSDFSDILVNKYRDWINSTIIDNVFGKDERSLFWRNYHFVKAEKMNKSNSVILHCENHIIIEFLGKASGPLYIYDKDAYNKYDIRFKLRYSSNTESRQYLLHNTKYKDKDFYYGGFRCEHMPKEDPYNPRKNSWQKIMRSKLKIYDITYELNYSK